MKVRRRLLARHRVGGNSVVLLEVPFEAGAQLIELMPNAVIIEPQDEGHDVVVPRFDNIRPEIVERILERRWRDTARKRAIAAFASRTA